MKHRFSIALLLHDLYPVPLVLGILVLLTGFGTQVSPVSAATPAFVRIIHASPDVGTADVFVDGTKLLSSFQFGAVTGYVAIPPGPHKVQIALVGKGIGGSVLSETLSVTPGLAYTVAAIGTQQSGPSLEVFVDSNYVVPGSTKVRVYNLAPDAGSISVSTGSNTLLSSLAYQQASNYLALSAGSYSFEVTPSNSNTNLPLSSNLLSNTVQSIFLVGMLSGSPQIQLVQSSANALPGMPGTGSSPYPVPNGSNSSWPLNSWFLALLVAIAVSGGLISVGTGAARTIAKWRTQQ
ncbi:MAG TPA: DUF4397 domain-containing protein [Ktedonobacteraceae bacterium]|nr:DUF4397 domain-containing protein [Ktedonobacteraceae bacterium]